MRKVFVKITLAILYLLSLLPLKVHYSFFGIFRFFIKNIFRYRYSVIVTNLSRSFPQLKYGEIKRLTNEYYKFMCDLFAETIWDYSRSAKTLLTKVKIDQQSIDLISDAQKETGRVIVVLGHCGNWEMISGFSGTDSLIGATGFLANNIYVLYKAPESKFSDMMIKEMRMHEFRKYKGYKGKMMESKELALHTVRHKDEKATFFLIADQNPTGGEPFVVNFLNQPTAMLKGPEYLSRRGKMAVIYLYMDRISRGQYKINCELITRDASKEDPGFVTKQFASKLERDINSNKVNWLWSHRRWKKTLPPME